ncbi:hypothetical protein J7L67_06675 [bacterium]|nr:hypothetical protein [bacterium]
MNCADFVVLPFRKIFTSGSVMLALSFSKPVIVPAIGPITELLGKTKNILYNVSKENSLLDALTKAIGKDAQSIGKKNYKLIKHLSWDYIAEKTDNVYKNALK